MKHLRIFWSALVVAGCIAFCAACNEDDEGDTPNADDLEEELVYTEAELDSIGYEMLLDAIAPYKEDSTTAIPERVVTMAKCLFPSRADEYYTQADSLEEASEHFLNVVLPAYLADKVQKDGDVLSVTVQDATLTFKPSSQTGILAEVDIDIPQLAIIKKLFYVRSSEWPANDGVSSPFVRGEIVRDSEGNYYVCARSSDQGQGILVTVNVLHEDWYSAHTHWQGRKPFNVYNHNADRGAFESLMRYRINGADSFAKKIEKLQSNYGNDQKAMALCAFLNNIYTKNETCYIVGCTGYKTTLWWAYYYYTIWFDYYNCRTMSIEHYHTPKRTWIPEGYAGTSQVTFESWSTRNSWTTLIK